MGAWVCKKKKNVLSCFITTCWKKSPAAGKLHYTENSSTTFIKLKNCLVSYFQTLASRDEVLQVMLMKSVFAYSREASGEWRRALCPNFNICILNSYAQFSLAENTINVVHVQNDLAMALNHIFLTYVCHYILKKLFQQRDIWKAGILSVTSVLTRGKNRCVFSVLQILWEAAGAEYAVREVSS